MYLLKPSEFINQFETLRSFEVKHRLLLIAYFDQS